MIRSRWSRSFASRLYTKAPTSFASSAASVGVISAIDTAPVIAAIGLGFLERGDLRLDQQDAVLRRLGIERFQAMLDRGQIMPLRNNSAPRRARSTTRAAL
jgi:hypothetical protein